MSDASRAQGAETRRPEQREMAFCHECRDEWYTGDHGLICPDCNSEFTEIIENNEEEDAGPPPLLYGHNPWAVEPDSPFADPGPAHGHAHERYAAAGRQSMGGGADFLQLLQTIVGRDLLLDSGLPRRQAGARNASQEANLHANDADNQDNAAPGMPGGRRFQTHTERISVTMQIGGGHAPRIQTQTHRFVHDPDARLSPRDANQAQPRAEPVDDLQTILGGLFQQMNPAMMAQQRRGVGGPPGGLLGFLPMVLNPGMAVSGDAVYTQEALDRIITQLMEQHSGGSAPGPAPETAIASLPKKNVDKSMLDDKDEGDCSVCMDTVKVGDEVTSLPCAHWFHGHCVAMWLREHNTCPICRKGITPSAEESQQSRPSGRSNTQADVPRQRPESEGSGSGIGERVRGWFGGGG